jgi:hypothetical protein
VVRFYPYYRAAHMRAAATDVPASRALVRLLYGIETHAEMRVKSAAMCGSFAGPRRGAPSPTAELLPVSWRDFICRHLTVA